MPAQDPAQDAPVTPMTAFRAWRRATPIVPLMLAAMLAACGTTRKDDDNSQQGAERLYLEAKEDLNAGNYEAAIKELEKVEGRAAGTALSQQASIDLAYAYYKTGDKAQALSALDRFIKLHPSSPALDYALYLRGLVNFNDNLGILGSFARQDLSERDQQASRDAYQSFRQLVEQFPASKYAADARLRMDYIVNALAAYELHVARYYFRRGAYVAAANRAQQAVQEFQQAPASEEALYIMVQSYDKLGLNQLRDDADRVLKKNFPNSRYLKEGITDPTKAWWQFW
jgi:outer membrane protein assembly factor BamD